MARKVEGQKKVSAPKAEAGVSRWQSYGRPNLSAGPPLREVKGQVETFLV